MTLVGATATSEYCSAAADLSAYRAAPRVDGFGTANASRAVTSAAVTAARVELGFDILDEASVDFPSISRWPRRSQAHPAVIFDELGRLADRQSAKTPRRVVFAGFWRWPAAPPARPVCPTRSQCDYRKNCAVPAKPPLSRLRTVAFR